MADFVGVFQFAEECLQRLQVVYYGRVLASLSWCVSSSARRIQLRLLPDIEILVVDETAVVQQQVSGELAGINSWQTLDGQESL